MQEKENVETFWANIHSRSNKFPTIIFFQNVFGKKSYGKKSLSHFLKKKPSSALFWHNGRKFFGTLKFERKIFKESWDDHHDW